MVVRSQSEIDETLRKRDLVALREMLIYLRLGTSYHVLHLCIEKRVG